MIRFDQKQNQSRRPLGFIVHDVVGEAEGDLARLIGFRRDMYLVFGRRADALFELVHALAAADGPVRSVAELMLLPGVLRGWGSFYQALASGVIDLAAVQDLLAGQVEVPRDGPAMFAVDTSPVFRRYARMVAGLGMQHAGSRGRHGGVPALPGWAFSLLVQVAVTGGCPDAGKDSWVAPMGICRVGVEQNVNEVAADQIKALMGRLAGRSVVLAAGPPLFLLDGGYCPIYLTQQLPAGAQILVRLRTDRVFFGRPGPRLPGAKGRSRKHGARMKLDKPDTWGEADDEYTHTEPDGTLVSTRAWHHRHPEPRQRRKWEGTDVVEGTLIRQEHTHPDGRIQSWWLWWAGPTDAFDLTMLAHAYRHRFTTEHLHRYCKQDLGWNAYTPLEPEQAQRWSWLVMLAYTLIRLTRPLADGYRLPWENPCPPGRATPRRARRAFRRISATLPPVARPPKTHKPGPGRPKGSKNKHPRTRHKVARKGRPANTGHPKGRSPRAKTRQDP
jgi:hypothetical protein